MSRRRRRSDALRRGVLLHQRLDALMLVSARCQQVLVRGRHFVLVQLHLRAGQIELVLQGALALGGGLRERRRQLRHPRLVGLEQLL